MKYKNLVVFIVAVLLFGTFVISQVGTSRTVDIDLNKSVRDNLTAKGIISPQTSPLSCEGPLCDYWLYQILPDGSIYGLGEHQISREYCDTFELVNITINESVDILDNETGEPTGEMIEVGSLVEKRVCASYSYYNINDPELNKRVDRNNLKWLNNYGGDVLPTREANTREIIETNTTYTIREKRR